MYVERGTSQILYGMLPEQTVDLEGRVWKVQHWNDPIPILIDSESVRRAVLSAISPWTYTSTDRGYAEDIHRGVQIEVVGLNPDRGIFAVPFPKQWRCKLCGRIETHRSRRCKCGAEGAWAQLQFVVYHTCGAMRQPYYPQCSKHKSVAVRLPGTMRIADLEFFCPDCHEVLGRGLQFQKCRCESSDSMIPNVHRAASVFVPVYTAVVNPPHPDIARKLNAAGGRAKALDWVLSGMRTNDPGAGHLTYAGMVESLIAQGFERPTAQTLAEQAKSMGKLADDASSGGRLPDGPTKRAAEDEALSLAYAAAKGRIRLSDLVRQASGPMRDLYESEYGTAMQLAGLSNIELLTEFPVVTMAIGYVRGSSTPGESDLIAYRNGSSYRAYGNTGRTEALLFQLDPVRVCRLLYKCGLLPSAEADPLQARLSILENAIIPRPVEEYPQPIGEAVATLVHSYAHRMIRRLATYAGIERDSLAEYLLPHHLSFIVYSATRGDFVLGGLQAVFETALHEVLKDFAYGEHRCPLDPGCRSTGGGCMACLHLGEPSCRWFNRYLSRDSLFGPRGYLTANV